MCYTIKKYIMKSPHWEPISIDVITSLIIDRDAVICPAQSNSLSCFKDGEVY